MQAVKPNHMKGMATLGIMLGRKNNVRSMVRAFSRGLLSNPARRIEANNCMGMVVRAMRRVAKST